MGPVRNSNYGNSTTAYKINDLFLLPQEESHYTDDVGIVKGIIPSELLTFASMWKRVVMYLLVGESDH